MKQSIEYGRIIIPTQACKHGHISPPECLACTIVERDELEQLCLDLVTGMDALSSLLIEHHSCHDDGTGSLICNVCASKTGKRLWKESDTMKQKWCAFQKRKYGKPF